MSNHDRWAWAEIDLDAIRHNVEVIRATVAPSAVWAVVKANGYGHGSVEVARAAIDAGAEGLCVALVREGIELRRAGVDAPILLLSEQPTSMAANIVRYRFTPTAYSREFIDALAAESSSGLPLHLKVDTGMQRVGAHPDDAVGLATAIASHAPALRLAGVFTHLAVADDDGAEAIAFTQEQLARLDEVSSQIDGPHVLHAANSAGALAHQAARLDLVRIGIAMYGISPGRGVDALCADLRPALEFRARVSFVKQVRAGSRISYGLRHRFEHETTVATIPVGYADGVPRRLSSNGGEVLIGGRRCPIVGVVTMDQLMVDCGDTHVRVGDDVVLIGQQDGPDGLTRIRAEDWATRLGTIGYEVVCGISSRVPRIPRRSIHE